MRRGRVRRAPMAWLWMAAGTPETRPQDDGVHRAKAEAGRKGGLATRKRYGISFYRKIGRLGGRRRKGRAKYR